jgi:hypothetical protein
MKFDRPLVRPANLREQTSNIITLCFTSRNARNCDEGTQDGTFVARRDPHFAMFKLSLPCRRQVARELSTLVVSARSMDELQYFSRSPSQGHCHWRVDYTRGHHEEMEIDWLAFVGARSTCASLRILVLSNC